MMENKKVNIYLKPSLLRGWFILRDSGKCLVIAKKIPKKNQKEYDVGAYHIPKKSIIKIKQSEGKDGK